MGCSISTDSAVIASVKEENSFSMTLTKRWQVVPTESQAKALYTADGTIGANSEQSEVEFRTLFAYPVAQKFMLEFSRTLSSDLEITFQGWMDICRYKEMTSGTGTTVGGASVTSVPGSRGESEHENNNNSSVEADAAVVKQQLATEIYSKYIRDNHTIEDIERDLIAERVSTCDEFPGIFDEVQTLFFHRLHDNLFVPFKTQPEYKKMNAALRRKYNSVKCSDFEYFDVLGEGGFGMVCSVRKKSTGMRYAMKLQQKEKMLEMFGDEPWRADFEKQAFASCKHPFIVELFFAFQTKSLAILVTSLGTGQDLARILKASGPLSQDQVLFYSAEIASVLSYLHHKNFVYRDLKPSNVLLNADGHIQLVDFGAVCDLKGQTLGICSDVNAFLPMYADQQGSAMNQHPLGEATLKLSAAKKKQRENRQKCKVGISLTSLGDGNDTIDADNDIDNGHGECPIPGNNSNNPNPNPNPNTTITAVTPAVTPAATLLAEATAVAVAAAERSRATTPGVAEAGGLQQQLSSAAMRVRSPSCTDDHSIRSDKSSARVRGASLIGTIGYMAPEMILVMMEQEGWSHNGYTKAVDWWSLGVTMYKLLTGQNPFRNDFQEADADANTVAALGACLEKYAALLEEVDYTPLEGNSALVDCLSKLLSVEEHTRLGYGPKGSADVASHPYYDSINWIELGQKKSIPPSIPEGSSCLPTRTNYVGVEHMFVCEGKRDWLSLGATSKTLSESTKQRHKEIQKQFENWDYTSAAAVEIELEHIQ